MARYTWSRLGHALELTQILCISAGGVRAPAFSMIVAGICKKGGETTRMSFTAALHKCPLRCEGCGKKASVQLKFRRHFCIGEELRSLKTRKQCTNTAMPRCPETPQ